jgi:DNA-binding XRE family transcriptional regulator
MKTTPDHMTGAELQTLREACGLTREALAELAQVQARTVKHWETRAGSAVPADVATIVTRLSGWVLHAAREGLRQVQQAPENPADVVLLRYRETAHMRPQDVAQGLRADLHGAMVARLVLDLASEGHRARVVWFDPEDYSAWSVDLGTHLTPDTYADRAAWAAQAVEAQARPHAGDQPPAGHTPQG